MPPTRPPPTRPPPVRTGRQTEPPITFEKKTSEKTKEGAPPITRYTDTPVSKTKIPEPPKPKVRHEHEYCTDKVPETTRKYKSTRMELREIETTKVVMKKVPKIML